MYTRLNSWWAQILAALGIMLASSAPTFAEPINLMWDPSSSVVAGYIVHVGAQSGSYTQQIDVGSATAFTYPDAVAGQRYCFAVSSYVEGAVSSRSNEVCGYSDAMPSLVNPGNQTSTVGNNVSLQLNGSDPYGQPVSYSATGLPPGLTVASTGFISGTGTTAGTYNVTARVSDGRLQASQSFTWTMSPPPVAALSIAIEAPTSAATYATTTSSIALQGTASGGYAVAEVRWMNDRGGSGVASGTTNWSTGVPLQVGTNVVTVTARDTTGRQAFDVLTVTYTAPPPPPAPTVTLSAQPYMVKGKKHVVLRWTGCPWLLIDIVRDNLPLTTTENNGSYTDSMKRGGSYTYRVCETGNRTNCSNSVAVIF